MSIIKKLEGLENIKESIIKVCIQNEKRAIIFDRETYQKIKAMRPKNIRSKNIIPIRGINIIEYINKDRLSVYGYDSLNESIILVWRNVNDNLYLLDQMRYKNKIEDIDINYNIRAFPKYISIALLKFKKRV